MRTGKNASDEEIAQELGLSEDELTTWQSQLKVTNIVSLNEYLEQGAEPVMDARRNSHFIQPEDKVEEEELKQKLEESLEVLTEKERKVILLYYYEDLTLKEISSILEVSESRISQLHTKALLKMRKKLGNYNGMIQRTQDVSTLKQNEDNRPVVEQQTIFSQEMKKVEQNLHQVVHAREKENAGYRYDAKEKGNGHYEKEERKKKDKKQQKADNVYLKGQTSGFDIKV